MHENRRVRGSDIMDKASYEYTRGLLIAQRKKIMDTLEEQGDFTDPKLVAAYYDNQRRAFSNRFRQRYVRGRLSS